MEFTGRICSPLSVKEITSKKGEKYTILEFVAEEEGNYPQKGCFKSFIKKEQIDWLDSFTQQATIGSMVEIKFNLGCKEFNGKYFNELSAYSIHLPHGTNKPKGKQNRNNDKPVDTSQVPISKESEDDLPF